MRSRDSPPVLLKQRSVHFPNLTPDPPDPEVGSLVTSPRSIGDPPAATSPPRAQSSRRRPFRATLRGASATPSPAAPRRPAPSNGLAFGGHAPTGARAHEANPVRTLSGSRRRRLLSDPLEERESGWSRGRSAKARNERPTHSGAGSRHRLTRQGGGCEQSPASTTGAGGFSPREQIHCPQN